MGVAPAVPDGVPQGGDRTRARVRPRAAIRTLCTAGSPLPPEGYLYAYEQLGPDVLLINGSGGTDVCTGLVSGSFAQPVYEGEISGPCLGVDAHAFDPAGNEVIGELGELVITQPMPSMPVALWDDADGERYRVVVLRRVPGRVAPGRLDPCSPSAAAASSPAAPTPR